MSIEKQLLSIAAILGLTWVVWDELKGSKTISNLIAGAIGGDLSAGSGGGGKFSSGDPSGRNSGGGGGGGFR